MSVQVWQAAMILVLTFALGVLVPLTVLAWREEDASGEVMSGRETAVSGQDSGRPGADQYRTERAEEAEGGTALVPVLDVQGLASDELAAPDWGDTLHEMNEQLHAEAELDDPGWPLISEEGEMPLPAVLHLGAEFSGDDRTTARVAMRQLDMCTRFEREQQAFCREMGVTHHPMWVEAA